MVSSEKVLGAIFGTKFQFRNKNGRVSEEKLGVSELFCGLRKKLLLRKNWSRVRAVTKINLFVPNYLPCPVGSLPQLHQLHQVMAVPSKNWKTVSARKAGLPKKAAKPADKPAATQAATDKATGRKAAPPHTGGTPKKDKATKEPKQSSPSKTTSKTPSKTPNAGKAAATPDVAAQVTLKTAPTDSGKKKTPDAEASLTRILASGLAGLETVVCLLPRPRCDEARHGIAPDDE